MKFNAFTLSAFVATAFLCAAATAGSNNSCSMATIVGTNFDTINDLIDKSDIEYSCAQALQAGFNKISSKTGYAEFGNSPPRYPTAEEIDKYKLDFNPIFEKDKKYSEIEFAYIKAAFANPSIRNKFGGKENIIRDNKDFNTQAKAFMSNAKIQFDAFFASNKDFFNGGKYSQALQNNLALRAQAANVQKGCPLGVEIVPKIVDQRTFDIAKYSDYANINPAQTNPSAFIQSKAKELYPIKKADFELTLNKLKGLDANNEFEPSSNQIFCGLFDNIHVAPTVAVGDIVDQKEISLDLDFGNNQWKIDPKIVADKIAELKKSPEFQQLVQGCPKNDPNAFQIDIFASTSPLGNSPDLINNLYREYKVADGKELGAGPTDEQQDRLPGRWDFPALAWARADNVYTAIVSKALEQEGFNAKQTHISYVRGVNNTGVSVDALKPENCPYKIITENGKDKLVVDGEKLKNKQVQTALADARKAKVIIKYGSQCGQNNKKITGQTPTGYVNSTACLSYNFTCKTN